MPSPLNLHGDSPVLLLCSLPRLVLPFDERWVLIHTVVEDETVGVGWGGER